VTKKSFDGEKSEPACVTAHRGGDYLLRERSCDPDSWHGVPEARSRASVSLVADRMALDCTVHRTYALWGMAGTQRSRREGGGQETDCCVGDV